MALCATAILFLFFCLCSHPLSGEEVRADWSETLLKSSGVVRIYRGAVSLRDTVGHVYILADSAHAWIPSGSTQSRLQPDRYLFVGGVSLRDSAFQLRADTLAYDPRARAAALRGGVELRDADRSLKALRLVYGFGESRLDASGQVEMAYASQGIWLRSGALLYSAKGDSGVASGATEALRIPSTGGGDTLRIAADTLRFSDGGERMRFSGSVCVKPRPGVHALCQTAHYWEPEGRMDLLGGARAGWLQEGTTGRDSVEIDAKQLLLGFEEGRLATLELQDSVTVCTQQLLDGGGDRRAIRADTCEILFQDTQMARLQARGRVEAFLHPADGAETRLEGDGVWMAFREGKLDSVEVVGACRVTHRPADGKLESRMSGRRISLSLSQERIRRVLVVDEALCEQTGNLEDGDIHLAGDRLDLSFEGGRLQRAVGEGGVTGRYVPAEKESRP